MRRNINTPKHPPSCRVPSSSSPLTPFSSAPARLRPGGLEDPGASFPRAPPLPSPPQTVVLSPETPARTPASPSPIRGERGAQAGPDLRVRTEHRHAFLEVDALVISPGPRGLEQHLGVSAWAR